MAYSSVEDPTGTRSDPSSSSGSSGNGASGSEPNGAGEHQEGAEAKQAWTPELPTEHESQVAHTVAAIPAYNEQVAIGSVVLQAQEHVDLVVVVDDGSTDATAEVARRAGARVLRHRENKGKGQSIRTIFDWAQKVGVQELVLLDGDGQHDPSQIPQLLTPIHEGETDISLGFRFGENTEMPFYRRIGKRVLDYATAMGTDGHVTDSQCGFRAFSREAIEALDIKERGFAVESEMLVEAREKQLSFREVPITCRYDGLEGSTEDPVSHGVGVLNRTVQLITERRPLLFMGVPAFLLVLAGVGLGTWVVWTLKMTGQFAVGTALLTTLFVLAGTFLGLTSVLLHVIPRTLEKHLGGKVPTDVEEIEPESAPERAPTQRMGQSTGQPAQPTNGHHDDGHREEPAPTPEQLAAKAAEDEDQETLPLEAA